MNGISPLAPRSLPAGTSPSAGGTTADSPATGVKKEFDALGIKQEGGGDSVAGSELLTSEGKIGVKRPSQEDSQEAPNLKKSNLDLKSLLTTGIGGMTVSPDENVFTSQCSVSPRGINQHGSCPATVSEQVLVPDSMVGLIIGRGGEQISRLQSESKCKIQMAQDSQGLPHRLCTLTGSSDAIAVAKSLIEQVISNENDKAAVRGGHQQDVNKFGGSFEMMIPGNLVARIIGKGGEVIKALQEETGAKIVIIQDSREYAMEKPLRITGSVEVVEAARNRVEQVLAAEQSKLAGFKRGWAPTNNNTITSCYDPAPNFDITEVISIPSNKVGLVMGKGGETIRQICLASGAHCQVDKNAPDGAREKNIVIKGRPSNVQRAKIMVSEKVGDVYDRGYSGDYLHFSNNQIGSDPLQPPPPPPGQTDYSQQWAEYYRSLGMLKEAEIIEQQMLSRAAPVQPDYSAQWAEYYRSMGKYKEAEAIEAQMKMKGVDLSPTSIYSRPASALY